MTYFIILTNPRSGSTWFADTLNNIEGIVCHDELLVKTQYRYDKTYLKSKEYLSKVKTHPHWEYFRKRNQIKFFDIGKFFEYFDNKLSEAECGGFKLMLKQIFRHPLILLFMLRRDFKIVRLKRENLLDIILSWEAMKYRKRGHNYEPVNQVQFHLDKKRVLKTLKSLDFWDKITDLVCYILPIPTYFISYEDIISDNEKWYRIIDDITQKKINNEIPMLKSKYKKSNTLDKYSMIENYEEIVRHIEKTKYKIFL